jgi:hypothetical protein
MSKVSYQIRLGGSNVQSGPNGRLLALKTQAALTVPVNRSRIVLHAGQEIAVNPGDEVNVELGYDDALHRVFTGRATALEHGIRDIRIEALGSFAQLAGARFNMLYEKQAAGDIVGDLLAKLQVQKAAVESGLTFATYVLDDGSSVWHHLQTLAGRCGFAFFADEADRAVFKKYAPEKTHQFDYGTHILDYAPDHVASRVDGVEVYGESPVGQGQGEDASSWLTKKEVKGAAGKSSGKVLRITNGSARNQNLAQEMAQNIMRGHAIEARGMVRVLGAAQVRLGDAVKLSNMPVSGLDGSFRVAGVCHRLNPQQGFITDISWEKL